MRLTKDVYLVGGGDNGFNLTHSKDSHVYVIDGVRYDFRAEADEAGAAAVLRKDDLCGLLELLSKSQDHHSKP